MEALKITENDVKKTLRLRDIFLFEYKIAESILKKVFEEKCNDDVKIVLPKVKILNYFYSAGIYTIDIEPMVKHIIQLAKNNELDKCLQEGNYSIVNKIAHLQKNDNTTKYYFSFATKFCCFHNPEAYPIYDFYIKEVLKRVCYDKRILKKSKWINENRITGSEWNGNPPQGEGYEAFVKIYKDFRDTCFENPNISFKDMDRYIWGSRKIESMKDSIRKEYTEYKNIWNSICENELNRYMNNNKTK